MAVQSDVMEAAGPYDRAKALSAFKLGDVTFYWITRACAISVLLILGGIILSLIVGAWPAMKEYGFAFLWTQRWAPSADPPVLGALGPIYGTLVTSVIAMMIAIPVGIGIAIFLTELCPQWLRRPIGIADRTARRHSLDHLRHVGLLRARAVPGQHVSAVHDQAV